MPNSSGMSRIACETTSQSRTSLPRTVLSGGAIFPCATE